MLVSECTNVGIATAMPLTDAACRSAKPSAKIRKLSDSGGLQLVITPGGSKLWRAAYRFGGKQKTLSLGACPIVPLADARESRDQAKKLRVKGIDPSTAKKRTKSELCDEATAFKAIAADYVP